MTHDTVLADVTAPGRSLGRREMALGVFLASLSGLAIIAHVYGPLPMNVTVPFAVFPSALLIAGLILYRARQGERLSAFSERLLVGGAIGTVATVVYDGVRLGLVKAFGLAFDPFAAHPIFGSLMTGLASSHPTAIAFGWTYHFWNGASFGMMYALMRPQGGIWTGLGWGLSLEWVMLIVYPDFLGVRLANPAFLATSMVGHGGWGLTLGWGLRRWHHGSVRPDPGTMRSGGPP